MKISETSPKFELHESEVTQFGPTVPYRRKEIGFKTGIIKEVGDLIYPNEWLTDYVSNCMPWELDHILDDCAINLGEYAEIGGFLHVEDTSGDTPCGWEYDSELHFEEEFFTVFKLEDIKKDSIKVDNIE